MEIRPYITFKGECQEAIDLYEQAFDSEVEEIMRFRDMPKNPENPIKIPKDMDEWVLMAMLPMGDNFIRLSDTIGELKVSQSDRVSIAVEFEAERVKKAFNVLAEDGEIVMPLQATFFSPLYGVVNDKFGVKWTLAGT